MTHITVLGIDLAKNVFQLCGLNAAGEVVYNRSVKRKDFVTTIAQLSVETIAMEACGSAHHWCRKFTEMGLKAKLLHPGYVKPFVKNQKNDKNDAQGIAIAASQKTMTFVPPKSLEQQDIQSLLRVRERLIHNRTQLVNEARGLLQEYGISLKISVSAFRKEVAELINRAENSHLTAIMQRTLNRLYVEYLNLESEIEGYDQELAALFKQSPECQRLSTIPGVGLLSALAIIALIGDIHYFRNARHLSAYLGLVPRQHSSGGHTKLFGVSKRGNTYLRTLLIHGARSVLWRVDKKTDKKSLWLKSLVGRCGFNKACVALANKQARTIWAILTRGEVYQENHQPRWGGDNLAHGCANS